MRWIRASDRMPAESDAPEGDVVARWQNELGTRCLEVVNYRRVRPSDEWLMGAWDQEYGTSGPVDRRNRKLHWAKVTYQDQQYWCRVFAFGELMDEYPQDRTLFLGPGQEWGDTSQLEAPCCVVWEQDLHDAIRKRMDWIVKQRREGLR